MSEWMIALITLVWFVATVVWVVWSNRDDFR